MAGRRAARASRPGRGVEVVHTTDEDEYFPPPPELRDLLRWLGLAASLTHGAPFASVVPTATDRQVTAAGMLAGAPTGSTA